MGITIAQKLRKELDDALERNRNANSSLAFVRTERDKAREERDIAVKVGVDMSAEISRQRQHIRRLFNSIFHLNMDVARKAGYIERVREIDTSGLPRDPDLRSDLIDSIRDQLAGAQSDKAVSAVIDGMDDDVLDQVFGRDPDADYDRG